MDSHVQPALATSASERLRPAAAAGRTRCRDDRRRELTPEVVDALVARTCCVFSCPGARRPGAPSSGILQDDRGTGLGGCQRRWFINQSNVSSATSAAAMPHESGLAVFGDPRDGPPGAPGTARARHCVDGGYRLTGTWSFASGGRHKWLGAHSATQNPDGTPLMRYGKPDDRSFVFSADARSSTTGRCSACAAPAATLPVRTVPDDWPARRPAGAARTGPIYTIMSTLLYATALR